ncbi:MAG: CDP-2,3-bis-(O-geranylgeranyl)-sn-glycerol synthase [archaeon]
MNLVLKQVIQWGLPMAIANMSPVFLKGTHPIDFGKEWQEKRILGKGKTFEGLIGGALVGAVVGFILGNFLLGLAVAFGALMGDIIESLIKRRVGIKSGQPWWVFDQVDFVIGGIILGSFVEPVMTKTVIILLIVLPLLHPVVNYIGYKLGVKKNKW